MKKKINEQNDYQKKKEKKKEKKAPERQWESEPKESSLLHMENHLFNCGARVLMAVGCGMEYG